MTKKKPTAITDGLEILDRLHFRGRPARESALAKAELNAQIAQDLYRLRTKAQLSQKALAELVGTTASAICRLEAADYAGHSLGMLHRMSAALGQRIEIRFVPIRGPRAARAKTKNKATAQKA